MRLQFVCSAGSRKRFETRCSQRGSRSAMPFQWSVPEKLAVLSSHRADLAAHGDKNQSAAYGDCWGRDVRPTNFFGENRFAGGVGKRAQCSGARRRVHKDAIALNDERGETRNFVFEHFLTCFPSESNEPRWDESDNNWVDIFHAVHSSRLRTTAHHVETIDGGGLGRLGETTQGFDVDRVGRITPVAGHLKRVLFGDERPDFLATQGGKAAEYTLF